MTNRCLPASVHLCLPPLAFSPLPSTPPLAPRIKGKGFNVPSLLGPGYDPAEWRECAIVVSRRVPAAARSAGFQFIFDLRIQLEPRTVVCSVIAVDTDRWSMPLSESC
jgi:hypothetical protein